MTESPCKERDEKKHTLAIGNNASITTNSNEKISTFVTHNANESYQDCTYLAFKYATSLKIWPLQDHAFQEIDRLNDIASQIRDKSSKNKSPKEKDILWSKEPRLFAFEYNKEGKRKYVTSHLGRFINFYFRECDSKARHYYELIREGSPCRLYFDIEYNKKANPTIGDKANESLMREFFEELQSEISNNFGISVDGANILDMDSSTEIKFSRHIIVHMPQGQLFKNNVQCGIFVKKFISRLAEEVATGRMKEKGRNTLQQYMFVNNKDSSDLTYDTMNHSSQLKSCIIDTGVYTRNRIFRIIGSTKFGKPPTVALRIASTNQYPVPKTVQHQLFERCMESTWTSEYTTKDTEESCSTQKEMQNKLSSLAKFFVDTLVVPCMEDREGATILPDVDHPVVNKLSSKNGELLINRKGNDGKNKNMKHLGHSPFPELDKFINETLATRNNVDGSMRSWSIQNEEMLSSSIITYQIKGNRWCENIQRCHKSNNIMWHVSIADFKYWQSCLDPDCRQASFRGQKKDLPIEIQEHIAAILITHEVKANDSFEKALLDLSIRDDQNHELNLSCNSDESFERALLDLNLSHIESNERDPESAETLHEHNHKKLTCEQAAQSSFAVDEDFEKALMGLKL